MDHYLTTYRKDYLWPNLPGSEGGGGGGGGGAEGQADIPKLTAEELEFYRACLAHSRPADCRCPQYGGENVQLPPGKDLGWSRNELFGPMLDPKLFPARVGAAPETPTSRFDQPNAFLDKENTSFPPLRVTPSPEIPAALSPEIPITSSPEIPTAPSPHILTDPSPDIPADPSADKRGPPSSAADSSKQLSSDIFAKPQSITKKKLPPKRPQVPQHIENSIETLKYQELCHKENEDEFSLFAKNIASQLRQLPLIDALDVQSEISELVKRKRINRLQMENNYLTSNIKIPEVEYRIQTTEKTELLRIPESEHIFNNLEPQLGATKQESSPLVNDDYENVLNDALQEAIRCDGRIQSNENDGNIGGIQSYENDRSRIQSNQNDGL